MEEVMHELRLGKWGESQRSGSSVGCGVPTQWEVKLEG